MKIQNNIGNRVPTGHWGFQYWVWITSHGVTGQEGPMEIPPQKNPGCCCQNYGLLSTDWQQGSIAEDNTHRTHWTWRCWAGAHIKPSPLCSSVFGIRRYSTSNQKRNVNIKNSHNLFIHNGILSARYTMAMVAQSFCMYVVGITNQCLIWLTVHSTRRNP